LAFLTYAGKTDLTRVAIVGRKIHNPNCYDGIRVTRRGIRFIRAAALLVAAVLPDWILAAEYEGKMIREVRFDPPSQPLPAGELRQKVGLQSGDMYRASTIRQAIENLYSSGRFVDIVVEADLVSDSEVVVTVRTENRWFTGGQTVEGVNEPPSQTQLVNASRLHLGEEFSNASLTQAVENLKTLLNKNGLYEANVSANVAKDDETEQADISFDIDAGRRARFTDPIVRGETYR